MSTSRPRSSSSSSPRRPARAGWRWLGGGLSLALALALGVAGAAPADEESADGRWRLSADDTAVTVRALDGATVRRHEARSLDGREAGRPRWLRAVPPRTSFLVAFDGLQELWEIPLDPRAEPIYDGFVHDYQMGEGIAKPGFLGVRRVRLPQALHAFAVDRSGAFVLGRGADEPDGRAVLLLVQLDVRRAIGRFVVAADPDLALAEARSIDGRDHLVVPDRRGGPPLVLDVRAARVQHR